MINCPACKSEIESGSWYCDQCGIELKCCISCGSTGQGEHCERCGDNMIASRLYTTNLNRTVQPKDSSLIKISAVDRNIKLKRPVKLYLVNYPLGIRFEAISDAVIGRKTGPYVALLKNQPYISGIHAIMKQEENAWTITDQGSSNGTFLNGSRISEYTEVEINEGDKIQLANIELVVEFE